MNDDDTDSNKECNIQGSSELDRDSDADSVCSSNSTTYNHNIAYPLKNIFKNLKFCSGG